MTPKSNWNLIPLENPKKHIRNEPGLHPRVEMRDAVFICQLCPPLVESWSQEVLTSSLLAIQNCVQHGLLWSEKALGLCGTGVKAEIELASLGVGRNKGIRMDLLVHFLLPLTEYLQLTNNESLSGSWLERLRSLWASSPEPPCCLLTRQRGKWAFSSGVNWMKHSFIRNLIPH